MSADISGDTITISMERFRELEALASKAIHVSKTKNEYSLRSYYNNKDDVNKRRRERYRLKKEAESAKKTAETAC